MSVVNKTGLPPLPSSVDLAEWDEQVSLRDDSYELVEGVPTVAPEESWENRGTAALLVTLLNAHRRGWLAASDGDVTIADAPVATVRRPDVVVGPAGRRAGSPAGRLSIGEALFVAEVVSETSVERDLVTKRREYARAGIPAYLVVDLRDGRRELTLYAERGEAGLFVDVEPAERVTLQVAGSDIPVGVEDLLP